MVIAPALFTEGVKKYLIDVSEEKDSVVTCLIHKPVPVRCSFKAGEA